MSTPLRNLVKRCSISVVLLAASLPDVLAATQPPRVRGRIVTPAGISLSGLEARLFELTSTGDPVLREVPSIDSDHGFEVALPGRGGVLEVTADGFGRGLLWLSPHHERDKELTLVLPALRQESTLSDASPAGTRLLGRVVDHIGRPAANAKVQVVRLDFKTLTALPVSFHRADGTEGLQTEVAIDGSFELELRQRIELPASDRAAFEVICTAPGLAMAAAPIQKRPEQEVVCRMTPERMAISGRLGGDDRVLDAPLPVHLFVRTDGAPVAETLLTDEMGRFASRPHFPSGAPYVVVLNHPEHRPQLQFMTPRQKGLVELPLEPGVDLHVEAREAGSGIRIAGAEVTALVDLGSLPLERSAIPSADGYRLPNLPPDIEIGLRAHAQGYRPYETRAMIGATEVALVVELEPAIALQVRVEDADGRPVADARITVAPDEAARSNIEARLRGIDVTEHSDHDGAALLEGLAPLPSYRISCTAPGFAPWWQDGLQLETGTQNLTITLDRGALVMGQVLHEDGSPVEKAIVQALLITPNPDDPKHFFATPEAQTEALTDSDGHYRLEHLVAGTYLITTELPRETLIGQFMVEDPLPPLPLLDGDVLQGLDFYLRPPGLLRLYPPPLLVDSDPPRVTFYDRADSVPFLGRLATATAKADTADGSFVVTGLAPGTYDVEVRFAGSIPSRFEEVEIAAWGETPLVIEETRPGSELLVRVLNAFGQPLADIRAELYPVTENELRAGHDGTVNEIPDDHPALVSGTTDRQGEILFANLENASYQLHLTSTDGGYAYESFVLARDQLGKRIEKELFLTPGIPVPIRVENANGAPVAQAFVSLTRLLPGYSGRKVESSTDPAGEAVLSPLQPGTYQAEIFLGRAHTHGLPLSRIDAIHRQTVTITDSTLEVLRLP